MEKKSTILSLLFVGAAVVSAVAFIIFSGITAQDYNYVQLEINPRVEFVCDKYFKVISTRPLNDDARIVLAGVDYKGMSVDDASVDFMDLCAKCGFIDLDTEDNAVNITVIDGITQALDVHVTKSIFEYLRAKEIKCTVIENYEDRSMFDEKKKNNVCCANKYKLIKTLQEYDSEKSVKQLNKLSEESLIDMVANIHTSDPYTPHDEELAMKESLMELNKDKYENHMNNITNKSQREFEKAFDELQKKNHSKYSDNFTKEYINWQNHIYS